MKRVLFAILSVLTANTFAQSPDLSKGVSVSTELSATLSDGDHAPFWLTANQYGVPSVERNAGHLRAGLFRSAMKDTLRHWDIGYGADFVVPVHHTSHFFVQQLYADVRWFKGTLTIGQKQQPMQLKNNELSSGSQTLGINARPYPEARLALPDYWAIPGTKGFLSFKGHIAFGIYTDNRFQKDFAAGTGDYDEHVLMHTKAGYLKFGKQGKPFSVEAGLEMATQFGNKHYEYTVNGYRTFTCSHDLKAFANAIVGGGSDQNDGAIHNNEGNMLGSWVLRLNYDTKDATFGLYADHFFEDHSAMFHLDYNGYASENGTIVRKDKRYLLYPLKDIMLGADVHLKHCKWLSDATLEYIYTRYQSGPVYADRTSQLPDHIGGKDDYYNNHIEPGWQHWGQAIGNPLYRSPIYNTDGNLLFQCNRFTAWHVGIAGQPTPDLHYRLRATWQEGLGTYDRPYCEPQRTFSMGIEANYRLSALCRGLSIGAAFGFDHGALYGDNTGGRLTLRFER
ncbi:MAG: capsule assembly Wzi family protein [Bacteroidaceae bacterium]|nr:capsule assembly Wzi family protein [Bacteroidaceae bacterium]